MRNIKTNPVINYKYYKLCISMTCFKFKNHHQIIDQHRQKEN